MTDEKDLTLMELFEAIGGGEPVELDHGVRVSVVMGHLCVGEKWVESLSSIEVEDLSRALRERVSDRFLDPKSSPLGE